MRNVKIRNILQIKWVEQLKFIENGSFISWGDPQTDRERNLHKMDDGTFISVDDGGGSTIDQRFIEENGPLYVYSAEK